MATTHLIPLCIVPSRVAKVPNVENQAKRRFLPRIPAEGFTLSSHPLCPQLLLQMLHGSKGRDFFRMPSVKSTVNFRGPHISEDSHLNCLWTPLDLGCDTVVPGGARERTRRGIEESQNAPLICVSVSSSVSLLQEYRVDMYVCMSVIG